MSTDLINEPVLAQAKNMLAQDALDGREMITTFIQPGSLDPLHFMGAVVQEANALGLKVTDKEMENHWTRNSFKTAIRNCAVLGLLPGEVLGHAYFVPFNVKDRGVTINLIPGYKGLLELAWASNYLDKCQPEVVLKDEECKFWHDTEGPQVMHEIPIIRDRVKLDTILAAYCTYTPRGGSSTRGKIVTRDEIVKYHNSARQGTPWRVNLGPMACKTSIRRTAKQWRMTRQLAQAVMLDEQAEHGEVQGSLVEDDEPKQDIINLDTLPEVGPEDC